MTFLQISDFKISVNQRGIFVDFYFKNQSSILVNMLKSEKSLKNLEKF